MTYEPNWPKGEHKTTAKATRTPTAIDLGWAAGFMEGEGHFGRTTPSKNSSTRTTTERVIVAQHNREPLFRLQALFGGTVATCLQRRNRFSNHSDIGQWRVSGARARGVMMTMFPLLSRQRRGQISGALNGVHHPRQAKNGWQ